MNTDAPHANLKAWSRILNAYRNPKPVRSVFELVITLVPFTASLALAWLALHFHIWWGLVMIVPAAGFLLRLFMIQHDCGHGAFFASRHLDNWVGRLLGVFTLTPYDYWRHTHAEHHATTGNLDKRGVGDIITLTVKEYLARTPLNRLLYRLYRHPLVMFGFGPFWVFVVQQRLPVGMMRAGVRPWVSAMATNAGIGIAAALMMWCVGVGSFLIVYLPVCLLAGAAGIWLFYVQHQFEDTRWAPNTEWDFHAAALLGSSHYDLPPVLKWLTGNIGIHHVHHLASRIPYYRLPEVLRDHPVLAKEGRITLMDSLRTVKLTLWDEDRSRLISFRQVRKPVGLD